VKLFQDQLLENLMFSLSEVEAAPFSSCLVASVYGRIDLFLLIVKRKMSSEYAEQIHYLTSAKSIKKQISLTCGADAHESSRNVTPPETIRP
jgi:hypothetical protein